MAKQRTNLSDTLFLYTTRVEDPISFSYEIENANFTAITLTLNFEGSENVAIEGERDGSLKLVVSAGPFSRVYVGRVYVIDCYKRASMERDCKWTTSYPSPIEYAAHMQAHISIMTPMLREAAVLSFPPADLDATDEKVHQICRNYGKVFTDMTFPPTTASLFWPDTLSQLTAGEVSGREYSRRAAVEWKRPSAFMEGEYSMFGEGIEPADIRQGALRNGSFLSAVAAVAEYPEILGDLFDVDEIDSHGVYRVRLCRNGWWQSVRIDDYIPCYPDAGPVYSRTHGNELWMMLLEKAYAKTMGSYETTKSGLVYEAMMDLTGAPCITLTFDDDALVAPKIESGELWRDLLHYHQQNYVLSVSTPDEGLLIETGSEASIDDLGLLNGYSYAVIDVRQTTRGDKLVKIRNPWGATTWEGDWSATSPKWTKKMQDEVEQVAEMPTDAFWMSFTDVIAHFESLNVCMVRHQDYHLTPWIEHRTKFIYTYDADPSTQDADRTYLGVNGPMYVLNVTEAGEFSFTVHQEDFRCIGTSDYIDIGIAVLVRRPYYNFSHMLMAGTGVQVERQCSTGVFKLNPGQYMVVPTSSGVKLRDRAQNAQFTRARGNSTAVQLVRENEAGEKVFTDVVVAAYSEMFDRMDCNSDGYLSKDELDPFMMTTEGAPLQEQSFQWLLRNFETSEAAGLSKPAFIRAQQYVFQHAGSDAGKLLNEFRLMGYNSRMELETGCKAVLSVHGTTPFTLESRRFYPKALEEALLLPIWKYGTRTTYEDGKIILYKVESGITAVSFAVENKTKRTLVFVMDCSKSENFVTHRASLRHQETIPSGRVRVMHHLVFDSDLMDSLSWSFTTSYMFE